MDRRRRCPSPREWRPTRSRRTASPSSRPSATASRFSRVYHRFETVVVRYFNVFGPRQSPRSQYAAVIPLFLTAIAEGRADHGQRRRRAARATSPTSTTSSTGRFERRTPPASAAAIFNVAASAPASVNELADTIGAILGKEVVRQRRAAARGRHPRTRGRTSPRPARRSAGSPTVGLEEGLRRTAEIPCLTGSASSA